jgi:hypothetical protein
MKTYVRYDWNHNVVMGWGAEGLEKRLGASVIAHASQVKT